MIIELTQIDSTKCEWTLNLSDRYYNTECGQAFMFSHNEPFEDKLFKYCPYCGCEIKEVE